MKNPVNAELEKLGNYLETIAKNKKLSLRTIANALDISVNSVKVVFGGGRGNISTYEKVCEYLGTSFCRAIVAAFPVSTGSGVTTKVAGQSLIATSKND